MGLIGDKGDLGRGNHRGRKLDELSPEIEAAIIIPELLSTTLVANCKQQGGIARVGEEGGRVNGEEKPVGVR
jgi:hypothetical protein